MARGLTKMAAPAALMLLAMVAAVGCGVKTPPVPSTDVAPRQVQDLKAQAIAGGVEVTFKVPDAAKPAQAVRKVLLYYGYLPLTGAPDCPPCPPRLHRHHDFMLKGSQKKLMEGGPFKYLDRAAPMGKEAFYRVELEDFSGRRSVRSGMARAPRVALPATPSGVNVAAGEASMTVTWQGPTAQKEVAPLRGKRAFAGYQVWRKGPDGERQLNERPLRMPKLVDKTVVRGAPYQYRVVAVDLVGKSVVGSRPSAWVGAATEDKTPPKPATDLMAASQPQGLFLRFTPSPDTDVAGYILYRKDAKGGAWARLGKGTMVENVYVDKNVKPMQTYWYRVVAVDESGNQSQPSEELKVRYQP